MGTGTTEICVKKWQQKSIKIDQPNFYIKFQFTLYNFEKKKGRIKYALLLSQGYKVNCLSITLKKNLWQTSSYIHHGKCPQLIPLDFKTMYVVLFTLEIAVTSLNLWSFVLPKGL